MKNFHIYLFLALGLLMFTSLSAQSEKQKRLEEKRQSLINEITQINRLLFDTKKEEKSVLTQVENLNSRISTRENLIRITNQQANLLTREINENINNMEQLRNELKELKEDYSSMIVKSYKSKSQQSRIMFLLSSQNFLQAYKRVKYMNQYTKHRKKQGENINAKSELLKQLNIDLIAQKKDKKALIEENKIAKNELTKEKKDQEKLVATLKENEGKFASQIRKKQKEADKIDKQIDALIKAAIAASNKKALENSKTKTTSSKTFALTAEAKALAASFTNNKGKLPWPVKNGILAKKYGKQQHPQLPNVTTFNSGVEIATAKNGIARAVFEGEVMQIQQLKGANKAIYIQHGNYITIYNNMATVLVKKGDKVSTKQKLGTIYTNPVTGKTLLKFLIYKNLNKMNPADWVYKM
ncbi:peptidoglycan DD-metalloendopeptidase family protein [Candidatus Marifrigoribacter sp. Uisw_064]|jgi:septal ring factor EnvC (AmiA/AmiB activator)|uniref:murein hydrolase activator EnvC family protein n=1 Tax=Candidatus Marifrigoribacter sp. Uisw_064 TaxID=3230970 RepID=UPI003D4B5C77